MNMEGFDQNNIWRLRLARYFQKALGCAELSPIYLESVQLQSLFKEFEEGVTSVCVIGGVMVGKRSFINALLGDEVLPISDLSIANVIWPIIKYGVIPKTLLCFQSPFPMDFRENISDDILDYLKWYNFGKNPYGYDFQIPSLEYSLQGLNFTNNPIPVEIVQDNESLRNWLNYAAEKSAFNQIFLYWPSEILKKRISIRDTQGIKESPVHHRKILKLASTSDIVILVGSAQHPFGIDEETIINDMLSSHNIRISGFVANRFDLRNHSAKLELYIKVKARKYVPENSVFCVSAKEALDAYKEGNDELLERSGIPKVKAFIEQLAVGKERERFIASSKELKEVICNIMLPSIKSEISKTFGEHRVEKMGNMIFISTELNSVVVGLSKLIDEIETQTSNETK